MLKRMAVMVVLAGFSLAAVAAEAGTLTGTLKDGRTVVLSYDSIVGLGSKTVVLTGRPAHAKIFDKAKGTTMDTSAEKIVVVVGAPEVSVIGNIKSVDLTGSPVLIHESLDSATGKTVKMTATGDHATYNGATETVNIKGHVRIANIDPAIWEGPAEMVGDEATVHVGKLGPDDERFRMTSSPGVSTITATPKPREETKPNK